MKRAPECLLSPASLTARSVRCHCSSCTEYRRFVPKTPERDPLPIIQPHTCPYREEVNNDCETLCTCTDEERHECLMDI